MSKTVMRVMMMIGLVALLGAKAEAHYYIVGGKVKYCDICLALDLETVPDNQFTPAADVTGISLELKCGDQTEFVDLDPSDPAYQVDGVLTKQKIKKNGKADVEFNFPVHLVFPSFCSRGRTPPDPVIIRTITVEATVFFNGAEHSTYTADCELPALYNVDNPPPTGTRYVCGNQMFVHN